MAAATFCIASMQNALCLKLHFPRDINTLQAAGKEISIRRLHWSFRNWQVYATLAENNEIDLRRSEWTRRKQKAKKELRKAVIFINGINWFVVVEDRCVFTYSASYI
jgi:hypothetical protein